MRLIQDYTHIFLYVIMGLYADLHIQIIEHRQFFNFLPIYCELSDNLKKDFLLLLYHTHLHLSIPNTRSGARGGVKNIIIFFLTNYHKKIL